MRLDAAWNPETAIPVLVMGPGNPGRRALRQILRAPEWEMREAGTYGEAVELMDCRPIGVAIYDADLKQGDWQVVLAGLQSRADPPSLIVSSRLADERLWAEVLNLGGYDVLVQPFDRGEVQRVARMAWLAWRERCPFTAAGTPVPLSLVAAS